MYNFIRKDYTISKEIQIYLPSNWRSYEYTKDS